MKDFKKEVKTLRVTMGFGERKHNKYNEIKDKRIKSASLNYDLYQKFIPTLKPICINLNPSPIKLTTKGDIYISEEKFSINPHNKYLDIEESIKEKIINSDEEYNCKLSHKISYSSEESNENKNKINIKNKNSADSDEKSPDAEKNEINCINHLRKSLDKIKNQIKSKKYKDDDDSILNKNYNNYNSENYRIKRGQNYINKLKLESMNEFNQHKNKTISFNESNSHKPPILGFLQKNELSAISNSTLSSCNLSEI